ncbi:MAG: cupredoxin domain-containing protein [Chloroflexi bacterium]|nr:cupredoxin domain-containing protein [Chloroflexota bacterium]
MSHSKFKIAALATAFAATTALQAAPASAQSAAPKAYIGLFGDNSLAVLDTGSSSITGTIPIPAGPHGLVVTPDGHWVYASSDGDSKVSVIDTQTDQVASTIEVGTTPHGLAITPDGSRVLVAGFGTDEVEAIDTSTRQMVWQTPVTQPHNIAISPDGLTAYAGSQKADAPSLAVIDIPSGTQTGSVELNAVPRALTMSPDGTKVFFTQAGVDSLQVLDRATDQIVSRIPTGASPHHPFFSPDGKIGMVVAQGPGELDLFDPTAFARTGSVKVGQMPHWIATSADNHYAYVTNENSNDLSVVDLGSMSVSTTVSVGKAPRKIAIQPTQQSASVTIQKFAFSPASMTIHAGDSVTWTNNDAVAHTTTSDDKSSWDSKEIQPNTTFTHTFSQPGTYTYHCSVHPFMKGTIEVQ